MPIFIFFGHFQENFCHSLMKLVKAAAADFLKFFYSFTLKHCLKLPKIVSLRYIACVTEMSARFSERSLLENDTY